MEERIILYALPSSIGFEASLDLAGGSISI